MLHKGFCTNKRTEASDTRTRRLGRDVLRICVPSLAPILHTLTRVAGVDVANSLFRSEFRRFQGDDVLWQPVFQSP